MKNKLVLGLAAMIFAGLFLIACGTDDNERSKNARSVMEVKEEKIKTQAKQAYLDILKKEEPNLKAKIDDVSFQPFLGIYDDALVAGFYIQNIPFSFADVVDSIEIDGEYLEWWVGMPILVWKDGSLFRFSVAAEQGILSKENLSSVKVLYVEYLNKGDFNL